MSPQLEKPDRGAGSARDSSADGQPGMGRRSKRTSSDRPPCTHEENTHDTIDNFASLVEGGR